MDGSSALHIALHPQPLKVYAFTKEGVLAFPSVDNPTPLTTHGHGGQWWGLWSLSIPENKQGQWTGHRHCLCSKIQPVSVARERERGGFHLLSENSLVRMTVDRYGFTGT